MPVQYCPTEVMITVPQQNHCMVNSDICNTTINTAPQYVPAIERDVVLKHNHWNDGVQHFQCENTRKEKEKSTLS
jgi:hypothetical protein